MDHGVIGLSNTLEACERAKIRSVGAGRKISAAGQLLLKEIAAYRVGVLAMPSTSSPSLLA